MPTEEKVLDYNALGQAIDTSWGRSSTPSGASQSVKFKIIGVGTNLLEVKFHSIVNFVSTREMEDLKKKYVDEANECINIALKKVKETYKDISETTIKFKQVKESDAIEIIDLNIYNGKKTGYFKRTLTFEMS